MKKHRRSRRPDKSPRAATPGVAKTTFESQRLRDMATHLRVFARHYALSEVVRGNNLAAAAGWKREAQRIERAA